ncbi:hypothetical protein SDC9_147256 [bioreactor metagenome]|uniref:Uncharacterized protein n=1 Tax=bioreactor metagenome TaxID=1076179 RepID=A0A645EFJ7_9ZZZZ
MVVKPKRRHVSQGGDGGNLRHGAHLLAQNNIAQGKAAGGENPKVDGIAQHIKVAGHAHNGKYAGRRSHGCKPHRHRSEQGRASEK